MTTQEPSPPYSAPPNCPSRYHLNRGVTCWQVGPHERHEGMYLLAGSVVTWTDADKPPPPPAPRAEPRTAMQEAFERARQTGSHASLAEQSAQSSPVEPCEWCGRAVRQDDAARWFAVKGAERGYDPLACDASDDGTHNPPAKGPDRPND